MENNETNKTLIIVIIAIAALCGCMFVSCCAISFFTASRIGKETLSEVFRTQSPYSEKEMAELVIEADSEGLTVEELQIIQATEKTRGIKSEEKLAPVYITEAELRANLSESMDEVSDEDLADELGLYEILAFAPKGFDLKQFYTDLYSEQIAGYYDPEDNTMYLIKDKSPYDNALTLSHEYTHYLQYNYPDFDETMNYDDDFCEENGETCIIIDALIEGDATLTESLVDVKGTILKNYENVPEDMESDSSVFDSAPKYFQDSLLFPYLYGFDFVTYYYLKGGFDAVNDLYIKLPQSVEQIMHPEKYLKDLPVSVTLEPFKSRIADHCEIIREDVLNESDVLSLLSGAWNKDWQLSERQAKTGAEGWGGGSFIYAKSDDKPLFFTKLVWDTENDAKEAEATFRMYSDKRFGNQTAADTWADEDGNSVYLIRQDDILYWMILPDSFDSGDLINLIRSGTSL